MLGSRSEYGAIVVDTKNCVRSTTGRVVLRPEIESFSTNLRNRGNLCNPNYYMSIRNC